MGKTAVFDTVQYFSLSEKVAAKLRDAIIDGHLPPDTKITESDLSTTLGVSRTVVREAIMMLVQEGLIVKAQNRYIKVASYTRRDIEEVYDMRSALELAGAKISLEREDIVERLSEKEALMLSISAKDQVDQLAFVYADMDFHSCIVESSGNTRLIDAWHRNLGPCLVLLYQYALNSSRKSPTGKQSYYDHSAIIRSFRLRDYHAVYVTVLEHVNRIKGILMNEVMREDGLFEDPPARAIKSVGEVFLSRTDQP